MKTVTFDDAKRAAGDLYNTPHGNRYICPVCGGKYLSISKGTRGAAFVVNCLSGTCDNEAVFKAIVERAGGGRQSDAQQPAQPKAAAPPADFGPGLTVAQYAAAKKLDAEWLRETFFLRDVSYCGVPAVAMPYKGNNLNRYRTGMDKTRREWAWEKGAKVDLYGQVQLHQHNNECSRRSKTRKGEAFVFLVEGESDTQTLAYNDWPVLGTPGVKTWKDEWPLDNQLINPAMYSTAQIPADLKARLDADFKAAYVAGDREKMDAVYAELAALPQGERLKDFSPNHTKVLFVWQEPGDDAAKFVQRVADSMPPGFVYAIKMTPECKDASALWLQCLADNFDDETLAGRQFNAEVNRLFDAAVVVEHTPGKPQYEVEVISADSIVPELTTWLWTDRVPLQELTMFMGMPDQGKSTVLTDLAARLTTGREMPDRAASLPACSVLMLVAEDDLAKTVVPRLTVAGADLKRIGFVKQTVLANEKDVQRKAIALDNDLAALERLLAKMPDVRAIIIDPANAYLGRVNQNKEGEVRPLLQELVEFAKRTDTAVIGNGHFNKNVEMASLHRLAGAGAWGAVPRAIWAFLTATDNGEANVGLPANPEHLMLSAKLNITTAEKKQGVKFAFESAALTIKGKQTSQPLIKWLGSAGDTTLEKAMGGGNTGPGAKPTVMPRLTARLAELLNNSPMVAGKNDGSVPNTIFALLLAEGYKTDTIYEAGRKLRIEYTKVDGRTAWQLPATPFGPQAAPNTSPY